MGRKREKLDVSGSQEGGLNDAFSSLELAGLPSGPEIVERPIQDSASSMPAKKGELILRRETAHRGGKTVVVVSGFSEELAEADISTLAKALKKHCGCGGTVKEREVEIQGEKAAAVADYLKKQGYRVRGVTQ